jgi:phosphate/phosphite/phosphonate ABC transporter binding protein
MATPDRIVFGHAARESASAVGTQMRAFAAVLSKQARAEVTIIEAADYEKLATLVDAEKVDLAWLPPIPFIALDRKKAAVPLVSHHRGGRAEFHSVIVVAADSRIRTPVGLKGKRAAWVDPFSAAGYAMPRIQLAALGVDPRTAFAGERFLGSHDAVVRAVIGGKADFAATYAGLDRWGAPIRGPWIPWAKDSLRVVTTFGVIPADVIAARATMDAAQREKLTRALIAASYDKKGNPLVRQIFGIDEFRRWTAASYELLSEAVADATEEGLLEGIEKLTAGED